MNVSQAAGRTALSALLLAACAGSPPPHLPDGSGATPEVALAPLAAVPDADLPAVRERPPASPMPSTPAEARAAPALAPPKARSTRLPSGLWNPMPGGVMAGYQADTGLDIAGTPRPVYAVAAGTIDYSEAGHTLWTGPSDTANCVRFELDEPIPYRGHRITHVYYAHLKTLESVQHEGETPRRHVDAGEVLGVSGVARHTPHLHIGFLLDGEVEQYRGTFLLADAIRAILGPYRNGDRLPGDQAGRAGSAVSPGEAASKRRATR
jgi:murein DD-endopeptidase MepM/ murein hydrolase activator NlpD